MSKISNSLVVFLLFSMLNPCIAATNEIDPYEKINRKTFKINKFIDKILLRPATILYTKAAPKVVRKGVSNVLNNLSETRNITNNLLQFKFKDAISDTFRLGINSTFGIGGLFDIASHMGLERHNNIHFGQSLAYWGWNKSVYIVLPVYGPSTFRDGLGVFVDNYTHPAAYLDTNYVQKNKFMKNTVFKYGKPKQWRYAQQSLEVLKLRALLLEFEGAVSTSSVTFDDYEWARNAFLQNRGEYNGNVYDEDLDSFYEDDF